ncbi:MAG TPA: DNA polymerase III subunit gamma/tau [Roseiarcus sp.]|nr:DNA polymerase III subunit gamma/tau [Roseiarcus sp.]
MDSGAHEPSLGLGAAHAAPTAASAYRVLARKYRPIRFEDLIGQEPMVRTIANAFASGRIHQAYILSGVRGVGKTTTARILARAFNYSAPGAPDAPSVELPRLGVHCQAIIESRHIDVIEMDAASHTGVDDVREIIENARYRPVSARYKVYIIDEVHMLSKQAFNALLKTLEEPPEHVKFIFATTEIEKVPITVRSRCLRFDLKRIDASALSRQMEKICVAEEVVAEPDALSLIARLAEGSARDALSLLDQAIAYDAGRNVTAAGLRAVLGLADRSAVIDLFELTMKGDIAAAMRAMQALYRAGADPAQTLVEFAEFTHYVTRLKIAQEKDDDPAIGAEERRRAAALAEGLALGPLTRAWQILLKALQEIKDSPRPLASAEMALIRLAYAADLPSPEEALRKLNEAPPVPPLSPASARAAPGGPSAVPRLSPASVAPAPAAGPTLASFEDVVALTRAKRDIQLQAALERDVRLERFEPGKIAFSLVEGASPQLAQTLSRRLQEWTGERWMVALAPACDTPTVRERAEAQEKERLRGVAAHPLVRQILRSFPGAEIVEVRGGDPSPPVATLTDEEIDYGETPTGNEDN